MFARVSGTSAIVNDGGGCRKAIVPSNFQITFKYMHEYNAVDRFQGDWFKLSFAVKAF
jgi:hypothetical protein